MLRHRNKRSEAAAQEAPARPLHGVNLSGWLVLEPWVTPSLFAGTGAFTELELAGSIEPGRYRDMIERHRETFVDERDFARIAARGFRRRAPAGPVVRLWRGWPHARPLGRLHRLR